MIVLAGVALLSGIATFVAVAPFSPLAALGAAPVAASLSVAFVGLLIARQADRRALTERLVEAQTDASVAALRDIAAKSKGGEFKGGHRADTEASRHRAA